MAPLRDSLSLCRDSLDQFEDLELQDVNPKMEQEEGLLSPEEQGSVEVLALEVEWHLRPGCAIFGSILVILLAFCGLVAFSKYLILDHKVEQLPVMGLKKDFRRPASDYVLDPLWDFHTAPQIREYNWTIVDVVANPDGIFRPMITINGRFPGPMIECNEGDTLVINVDNQGGAATSLHFHGIFQIGSNWMDGAPGISQCPIPPRQKFQYRFAITGQSGTYYYHGHSAVQASDGLVGPLVVHSKDERKSRKIPYASDRVIMLQDYYYNISSELLLKNLSLGQEGSPVPDGALINGLNQRDCSRFKGRACDNSTASLSTFDLAANARHRLRFINVGAFAYFHVSIDAHELATTEADGTELVPSHDTKLIISPAQRYSAVISTDQSGDSFFLRARMMVHCWGDPADSLPEASEVMGIIHYGHRPKSVFPTSRAWEANIMQECKDMNSSSLIPAVFQPAPKVAAHSYYVESNIEIGNWRLERGFFNQSSLRLNMKQPMLHHLIEDLNSQNESLTSDGPHQISYPHATSLVIQHAQTETIDLVIRNFDESPHPMHLHGHKFFLLGAGHGPFPGYAALGLHPDGRGTLPGHDDALDALVVRDTATLEGFGWLAIRFVTANPGLWAFHCHMAWHSEKGLAMAFLNRAELVRGWAVPEGNRRLCEADVRELEMGMPPRDEFWEGLFVDDDDEDDEEED